jgi:hypothetical protein
VASGQAKFWCPWGLAVDGGGDVYIAEYGNNKVRKLWTGLDGQRNCV